MIYIADIIIQIIYYFSRVLNVSIISVICL